MRYVKYLIDQVRKQTENEEVTDYTGIQDSEFLQYLNDAQHNLQAIITQKTPDVFTAEKIISAGLGVDRYSLPSDCYLNNKITNVEYSATGNIEDYYVIEQDTLKRRVSGVNSAPLRYIRQDGEIILNPAPQSSGSIRLTYIKRVRELDLRRAKVKETPTVSSTGSWFIDISEVDVEALSEEEYVCVVDKQGKTIVKNIPVKNVSGNRITLEAHTLQAEDSSILQNHYIVGGLDTSTHGDFDRSVERYMIAYCAWKILKRDSSVDSTEAMTELSRMAQEIVESYAAVSDDVSLIPELNSWDDWSY
jgi:hypothetical protein